MRSDQYLACGTQVLLNEDVLLLIHQDPMVVMVGDLPQGQCLGRYGQQATLHGRHLEDSRQKGLGLLSGT